MKQDIDRGDKSLLPFYKKLEAILNELDFGLSMQDAASKIMISLANDLLDFAQMRNGKFRKNEQKVDVKKAIDEIVLI